MLTVSTPYLQLLLAGGRAAGVHVEDLLTVGLCRTSEDPEGRVAHERSYYLWEEIGRLSEDPYFGLHLAEKMKPGSLAILEYAARNAPDLGSAYRRVTRYARLVHDGAEVRLTPEGDEATLSYDLPSLVTGSARHAADFVVAAWVVVGRQLTGVAFNPLRVGFQHPPADTGEYRRLFGCPVEFNCDENYAVLSRSVLAHPVLEADPTLCVLLDRYAQEMLSRLPESVDLVQQVQRLVSEGLRGGDPSLEAIAKRMSMSPRTLQRRLKEEGTAHQELLEEMRRELAKKYLKEPTIAIGEAAFLLGFSEPSAFHRAFKRWTGSTPGEYRRQATAVVS